MLQIDRLAIYILMTAFALMLPSMTAISFIDELVAMAFLGLALLDIILNHGAWRRYRPLILAVGIMAFYAVYSMTAVSYNSRSAILVDALIELKPYLSLFVLMGIRPRLTGADRTIFKAIALINILICAVILPMPKYIVDSSLGYIAYGGIYIFVSSLVFIYCSIRPDGTLSRQSLVTVIALCALGLLCGRSKFYAEFVFLIFYLLLYRPGMIRRITAKQLLLIVALCVLVTVVTWEKFSYYYLGGNISSFDPDVLASYARPVLFMTGAFILIDHFPFGSGLASFASAKSAEPYSGLYAEYGIDKVYGLSPTMPEFICDAYYPTLSQFGVAGVALFAYLWIWLIRQLGKAVRNNPARWRVKYSVAMLCILFILIESTGGTAVTTMGGIIAISLLGLIAGEASSSIHSSTQPVNKQITHNIPS